MARVERIAGTITLTDGSTSEFSIETDGVWQQWGAAQRRLGQTVDVLDALTRGLFDDDLFASEGEEEDEEEDEEDD